MHLKVFLRTPPDVLAPNLPPELAGALPDIEVPDGCTVEALLKLLGVGRARPIVLINRVQHRGDSPLHEGDRVDLALPIGGG